MQQLNRAQDQLLPLPDRIGSLVGVQQQLLKQTEVLLQSQQGGFVVQGQAIVLPSWLTSLWLSEQQQDIEVRTQELFSFCRLILESIKQSETVDSVQQENIERTSLHLGSAIALMTKVSNDLIDWSVVSKRCWTPRDITLFGPKPWENFADIKTVVEWTHRDNTMMRELLNQTEQVQQLFPKDEQKQEEYQRLLAQNQLRLTRLEHLLTQEKNSAIQQAQQSQGDDAIEQLETIYEMAETHRTVAFDAIDQLAGDRLKKEQALEQIEIINESVRQLRMLFLR